MQWLTPITAVYAAIVSLPLLLLLYFLKLKRREQLVSSTLLWKRAVQDLQVNAPFQRLRRNILLFLQILALLAILFALAGPMFRLTAGAARRYVLLIDRSASMNSTDVKPTRLGVAKKQAKAFVASLENKSFFSLGRNSEQIMVIAFDDHPKVMCNFTSDKPKLYSAIDAIEPTDGGSSLAEATVVAQAFAQSPGVEADYLSAEEPAQLVMFSDGRIHDLEQTVVGSGELVFHSVGKSADNVAIVAMQARRSYENPDQVEVFATLANYGRDEVTCDIQLSVNGDVRSVKSVPVPACKTDEGRDSSRPGKTAVNFTLSEAQAGVLEVRHLHSDSLFSDDAAWDILPAPKRLSVLLVTAGNLVLESALRACSVARVDVLTPARFDANEVSDLDIERSYDLIVLDDHVPARLPRSRYLVFGRPPAGIDISLTQQLDSQVIVDWRQKHAVMKYVNMANLFAAKSHKMELPRDAEVLAEFNESAAIALLRRKGSTFLLVGFDVLQSNWPFEPSFVLFCYNAAGYLGMQLGQDLETDLRVGQPIVAEGVPRDAEVRLDGPGFSDRRIEAGSAGSIHYPATYRTGVYALTVGEQETRLFAVNMLNPQESNIARKDQIVLSGEAVQAQRAGLDRANLPLWPFLVGLALFLASLEWLIYNLKVKI
jgi:hypothetical protein